MKDDPTRGPGHVQVVLRLGDRRIDARVSQPGQTNDDVPMPLTARREGDDWVVDGPEGPVTVGSEPVTLRQGQVAAEVQVVPRRRFSRFGWGQGDAVLPVMSAAVSLLVLQLGLLQSCVSGQEGAAGEAGAEVSPEYIARLLEEQYDGAEEGVRAIREARPTTGEKIDSFWLQQGHDGPKTRIGGGKRVGKRVQDGDSRETQRRVEQVAQEVAAAEAAAEGASELPVEPPAPSEPQTAEEGEDQPIAVHVNEGWGLTDWYDTQDANQDAQAIERQLKLARQLLKLDPDDPYGLSIRAYYEYLAMDWKASKRTYEKYTTLYPDEAAGWNNLALTYKREKKYVEEEALYRKALQLEPLDETALNNLAVNLGHQKRFDEALDILKQLETLDPENPYCDLHRAKVYAEMGEEDKAYRFLQSALATMKRLDTLHNIEFRQDIRLDPSFAAMREQERFHKLLLKYYGDRPEGWWNKPKGRR
jgi:tetratricopeptide (TPR) repeat protein